MLYDLLSRLYFPEFCRTDHMLSDYTTERYLWNILDALCSGVKSNIWFLVFGLLRTKNNNLCLGNLRATRYSTDFLD